jgi:galactokinase
VCFLLDSADINRNKLLNMEVTRVTHTDKDYVEGKNEGDIEIFVPGRLCILGEHSDWAAEFRTVNPTISYGRSSMVQYECYLCYRCCN